MVVYFIEQKSKLSNDIIDSIHFYDEIWLFWGDFTHFLFQKIFQIIKITISYLSAMISDFSYSS